MMELLYKAGFMVSVTSVGNWLQNDSVTTHVAGLFEKKARTMVEFAELFGSTGTIGNQHENDGTARDVFWEFHQRHPNFIGDNITSPSVDLTSQMDDVFDACMDQAYDMGLTGTDFFTRACEKITVSFFMTDVLYYDLSTDFVLNINR